MEVPFGHRWDHPLEFLFPTVSGNIKAPQLLEFLEHLQRPIRSKLLLIWNGLPAHRSRLVREYVASLAGHLHLEYLPAYAPELNPVEYIWGYCKQQELPNLCPKDFAQLTGAARNALGRMRRRPTMVESFWKRRTSQLGGQLFQITYTGGTGNDVVLTHLATPPPPTLTIAKASPASVRLLWATNNPPFSLQVCTNLAAANWTAASPLPVVIGGQNVVTNSITGAQGFYRLSSP